jgi:hypothetical protein
VALGQVGRVRRDAVGHEPGLDVVAVGEAQVLLRGYVAEEGCPQGADVGFVVCGGFGWVRRLGGWVG